MPTASFDEWADRACPGVEPAHRRYRNIKQNVYHEKRFLPHAELWEALNK
jgi:hypothetical protein